MKYNNDSEFFKDWTTKKLKDEAKAYDESINGETACYGASDIRYFDAILAELSERGIKPITKLEFNE